MGKTVDVTYILPQSFKRAGGKGDQKEKENE